MANRPGENPLPASAMGSRAFSAGRVRLWLPFASVGLVGLAVAVFWLYIADRTRTEIDLWIAREAALGRDWSCGERRLGGFPFRVEFTCQDAALRGQAQGRAISGNLTRLAAVAQVYSPDLVRIEAVGPLKLSDADGVRLEARWSALRASLRGNFDGAFERLSIEGEGVWVTMSARTLPEITVRAEMAQLHLRPTPAAPIERSVDIALSLTDAAAPGLALLFGRDAIDLDGLATLTEIKPLSGQGLGADLEKWREAGGRLRLSRLRLDAPGRRLEAAGELALDGSHRAQGRVDLTLTGLDGVASLLAGGQRDGGVIGALSGATGKNGTPKPIRLTLRLENGRAMLGPLAIATLPPLY